MAKEMLASMVLGLIVVSTASAHRFWDISGLIMLREEALLGQSAVPIPSARTGMNLGRKLAQTPSYTTGDCLTACSASAVPLAVCASDGKSYDNPCVPACNMLNITYFGKCSANPCLCPALVDPVCGGSKTYLNTCFATCANATSSAGSCAADCTCANVTKSVVCGRDGKNYDNQCLAFCAGVESWYSGPCDPRIGNCSCTPDYKPVCAENKAISSNQTYATSCFAQCDGATTWTDGVCSDDVLFNALDIFCGCPLNYDPVCTRIGSMNATTIVTNPCIAKCYNFTVVSSSICDAKPECLCPFPNKPVCANNVTYANACLARCNGGASSWTDGNCAGTTDCKSCPLPTGPDAVSGIVCGEDGMTYLTECLATCKGVAVKSNGACGVPMS